MTPDQSNPQPCQESQRPIEFGSAAEEVAVGTLMGCFYASFLTVLLSGFVGAVGASVGDWYGGWRDVGGCLFIWTGFWLLPLLVLMPKRPAWRFFGILAAGGVYLAIFQWHVSQRDIGRFYPWILAALPLGIILGTFYEPIRLARGGSTKRYLDEGLTIISTFVAYGNRNEFILEVGNILGFVGKILALGRPRAGAGISGLLGGGLVAAAPSALLAYRGDENVAYLFFGSVWNIAWIGTAIGAITGATAGWWAATIRERQEKHQAKLLESNENQEY